MRIRLYRKQIFSVLLLLSIIGSSVHYWLQDTVIPTMIRNHPRMEHSVSDKQTNVPAANRRDIAIGLGITTRINKQMKGKTSLQEYPFFKSLLPSFCNTCSTGFNYSFYLAYDYNDEHLSSKHFSDSWLLQFTQFVRESCPPGANVTMRFVRCPHSGNPAWAQNDAMMEAYFDNIAYYYRVNDDTKLVTPGWTEGFIQKLGAYDPPNVGVVGPKHRGGIAKILTYDFVHITHVNVFGFYYPREFPQWYGDHWITHVYKPGRSTKMKHYSIAHTLEDGRRYENKRMKPRGIRAVTTRENYVLLRYIDSIRKEHLKPTGTKLISMGLWGQDPRYTYGAVRNAQLMPVIFPEWVLRVYVSSSKDNYIVPPKVIAKLKQLGADVVNVAELASSIPPERWRLLITKDLKVTHFLIRDADSRLSERDSAVVSDWLKSDKPFHCIRDNKVHIDHPVTDGLWGGKPQELTKLLTVPWDSVIHTTQDIFFNDQESSNTTIDINNKNIMNLFMWPKVRDSSYCHDSMSCDKWPNAIKFPVRRNETAFLGQSFGPYGEKNKDDIASGKAIADDKCVVV